ncbi:MAG: SPOCS domain-containing protein [Anaerovoracaceae bacterium]
MNELIHEDNNNWEEIIPEYAMIPAEEGPKLRSEASSDSGTAAPAAIKAPEPAQKTHAEAAASGPGAIPAEAPVTQPAGIVPAAVEAEAAPATHMAGTAPAAAPTTNSAGTAPAAGQTAVPIPAAYADAAPDHASAAPSPAAPLTENASSPAHETAPQALKLIPATEDLRSSRLRLTRMHMAQLPALPLEEDILVPDTRPDLEKILSVTAVSEISGLEPYGGKEGGSGVRIRGILHVTVLYLPRGSRTGIVSITSRLPFQHEAAASGPLSAAAKADVRCSKVQSRVINERKIRIAATMEFTLRDYGETEIELLEGVRDESLLLRKETLFFTDLAQRRTDTTNVREKIRLKDSYPAPEQILRSEVNVVEHHHQIARGKAVITGNLYFSILYLPETEAETEPLPVYYRGRTDFTQFIRLGEMDDSEIAGSTVHFELLNASIQLRRPGEAPDDADASEEMDSPGTGGDSAMEDRPFFVLKAGIASEIQVYRNLKRDVVTDMYHRSRELEYSSSPVELTEYCGSGAADISLREIVEIPENQGSAAAVPFADIKTGPVTLTPQQDRCVAEGILDVGILYLDETREEAASCSGEIPFRGIIEIPGALSDSHMDCSIQLKEIWTERINPRQVEVNCTLGVSISAWNIRTCPFIDRVCYVENGDAETPASEIILYMVRPGDSQWSVAKQFRTTVESLQEVNELAPDQPLEEGMKLLIV